MTLVRLLVQDTDRDLLRLFSSVLLDVGAPNELMIVDGKSENDILQSACLVDWDAALLIVNNVRYSSDSSVESGATDLIAKLVCFERPIIACYGWPEDERLIAKLLAAGATTAFRIPCDGVVLRKALARTRLR